MNFSLRPLATTSLTAALALVFALGCGQDKTVSIENDSDQYFSDGSDFAGSHVLIAWQGSERASGDITRTKEEALAKAKDLIAKLKAAPDTFADVAKEESDGPSASQGGSLGSWKKGRMVAEFDTAIQGMEVGGITDEPVETQFGYHVIIREPIKKDKFFSAYAFIISHVEIPQHPPTVTRTKIEADSLVESLTGTVNADNFEELSALYNDVMDKPVFLGAFTEANNLPDGLLETVEGLEYGEVGGPIEFQIGHAFVRRVRTVQLSGSHILISYQGAERADASITRTKEDAAELASNLADQIASDPEIFNELATKNSDDSSGPLGGSLGTWFKGSMVEVFDSTIASLNIGSISGSVESPFGFHIIRRDSIPD